jgi:hypothetical protein
MKLTYQSKETVEYLRHFRQYKDVEMGTVGVMVPYMSDGELDEYVKARSGEVKTYKLEGSE